MLLTLLIPLIILSFTLSLHYHQHFKLRLCGKPRTKFKPTTLAPNKEVNGKSALHLSPHKASMSIGTVQFQIQQNRRQKRSCVCRCSLLSKDEENFDFFPASFFYYLIFQICVCALMIIVHCIHYYLTYHTLHLKILYTSSIETQPTQAWILTIDYILIYSVMVLLIWASLFSFWKYYTTMAVVQTYAIVPTKDIIRRFALYAISFTLLFVFQTQVYYWLWPLLLITHSVFNLLCTIKFSSVLIEKYRLFMEIDDRMEKSDNESILRSVYSMRNLSATCNLLQTIYLALFSISSTRDTIYYLPIFWGVSSALASLTFVRNRKFIHFKLFELRQRIVSHKILRRSTTLTRPIMQKPAHTDHEDTGGTMESDHPMNGHLQRTVPNKSVKFSSVDTESTVPTELTVKSADDMPIERVIPRKQRSKALQLLGIDSVKASKKRLPFTMHARGLRMPQVGAINLVYSQSDIIANRSGTISEAYRERNQYPMPRAPPKKIIPTLSHSDITDVNKTTDVYTVKALTLESIADDELEVGESEDDDTMNEPYIPRTPLRRFSSGMYPDPNSPNSPNHITVNVKDIDFIDDDDEEEDDEDDECVYVEYAAHKAVSELVIDVGTGECDGDDGDATKEKQNRDKTFNVPLELKHHKSNSEPIDIQDLSNNMDLNQVMDSLDLFAKYGFCSRCSINSLYQLTKYRNKINLK